MDLAAARPAACRHQLAARMETFGALAGAGGRPDRQRPAPPCRVGWGASGSPSLRPVPAIPTARSASAQQRTPTRGTILTPDPPAEGFVPGTVRGVPRDRDSPSTRTGAFCPLSQPARLSGLGLRARQAKNASISAASAAQDYPSIPGRFPPECGRPPVIPSASATSGNDVRVA